MKLNQAYYFFCFLVNLDFSARVKEKKTYFKAYQFYYSGVMEAHMDTMKEPRFHLVDECSKLLLSKCRMGGCTLKVYFSSCL